MEKQNNIVIRIIPIIYETLPAQDKFLESCKELVKLINKNELFKFYKIKTVFSSDLIRYIPYLIKDIIPPKITRYNDKTGWLGVNSQIKNRLSLLKTNKPVNEREDLKYPELNRNDILVAIIPADVRTTKEIYEKEKHFSTGSDIFITNEKAIESIYHVGIINKEGKLIDSILRELDINGIAISLIGVIASERLGIDDVQMELVRIKFGYKKKDDSIDSEIFNRLRVLFYGGDICSELTLKKAILLFDEIHFYDRPAINVGGNWGTIGSYSRIRRFVYYFAKKEIPILVHKKWPFMANNLIRGAVATELNDKNFSKLVFEGFQRHATFRNLFISPNATYGKSKSKGYEVIKALEKLELGNQPYFLDDYIKVSRDLYTPSDEKGLKETFAHFLIEISMILSYICALAHENDLIPFTEYPTFEKLLASRYKRAINKEKAKNVISKITLKSFSQKVFEFLIPDEALEKKSMDQVINYRNETREPYERFRQYLMKLNNQIESNIFDENYEEEIKKVIVNEIIPQANKFRDECTHIWEKMFDEMIKNVIKTTPVAFGALMLSTLPGLSWAEILAKGCALYIIPPLIDFAREMRNLKRENSLSYLLKINKKNS